MQGGRCELCGRRMPRLERHHLIPRTRHSNKRNKRMFERAEVHERLAMLCEACHATVHATFSEKELEQEYNTVEALAAHPDVARFVRYARKQPPTAKIRVRRTAALRDERRRQRRRRK